MNTLKNSTRIILVGIICICFLSNCKQSVMKGDEYRSEYYAKMPFYESPLTPFKGAYPISQTDAQNRIHLKFDYDKDNRVIQATLNLGEHLKESEGFLGSLYIQAPKTKVQYKDQTENHFFYDRFDNQISVMDSVFEKRYIKDSLGRYQRLIFLNAEGKQVSDLFGVYTYEWEHQLDGKIVELRKSKDGKIVPLRRDFHFLRTRITYGTDGYVSTIENIDETGKLVNSETGAAILKYIFDKQGRFFRWEVYNDKGKPAIGPSSTAGEYNLFSGIELTDIVFFDTVGKAATHWSGVEHWNFTYDNFGNTVQLSYLDANGQPKTSNNGSAFTCYKWSEDGRFLMEQYYLDVNKKRTNNVYSGISKITYTRNSKGLIIETHYFDINDQPAARKDNGVAMVKYEYDAKNKQIKSTKYSLENKVIEK